MKNLIWLKVAISLILTGCKFFMRRGRAYAVAYDTKRDVLNCAEQAINATICIAEADAGRLFDMYSRRVEARGWTSYRHTECQQCYCIP